MTPQIAALILWCIAHADDNPASDCGLLPREVRCLDRCAADDEVPLDKCPALCITPNRVRKLLEFPLYNGGDK
jgi:hypothetical protein